MKKLLTSFLLALFLVFPVNIFAHGAVEHATEKEARAHEAEVVDVYALFWPVTPGQTVADGTFFLKQLKESFDGFFKRDNGAKAAHNLEISEKRLVEAVKLLETQDFSNAKKSLDMNESSRNEAVRLRRKALEENQDLGDFIPKLVKSLENQQKSIAYMAVLFPAEQQTSVQEMADEMTLQISEAQ